MSAKQGRKFCLNCGNELKGCYCHECGQRSDNFHRSLKKLFLHFLDEFFTFDSKFFRSFIPFIFKPGRLTNEYLSGKQVSYVAPFRLYFFTVIVFLFIQGIWNPYQVVDVESDSSIISFKSGENSSDKVSSEEQTEAETETEAKEPVEFSDEMKEFLKENGRNSEKSTHNSSKKDDDFFAKIASNAADLKNDAEARKRFVSRFFHMIPNMLIVLMPFFALILKMLHLRWKEFYYVDHLVFSLHFHAFGFFF